MNRKFKEIDVTISGLNQSTDAHFKWLVKVLRFIASKEGNIPEISGEDAHHYCDFGHWLNEKLLEEREDKNFLLDINKQHIVVHHACRQLIATIEHDKYAIKAFNTFELALLAFSGAISCYKQHLLQLRTSYDALTGLPLRRVLDESFPGMNRALSKEGLWLMLLDVDHFKKVNDKYGHLNGDIVLRALATQLEGNIRLSESVYRYGGEEFIILLQAPGDTEAISAAERLRQLTAATEITAGEYTINITFTASVTRIDYGESLREVLERADLALYKGKASGRNCTMMINSRLESQKINP